MPKREPAVLEEWTPSAADLPPLDAGAVEEWIPTATEAVVHPPALGPNGFPATSGVPVGQQAREVLGALPPALASLGGAIAGLPGTVGRLGAGAVGTVFGTGAGDLARGLNAINPWQAAGTWLKDNAVDPAKDWYIENTAYGKAELTAAGRSLGDKLLYDPTYLARNVMAQAPQMVLSAGSASLAGVGASVVQQMILPSILQIGEVADNLNQYEQEHGPISDAAFGLAAVGGGVLGGALELAGAKGLMGQFVKYAPGATLKRFMSNAGVEAIAEGLFEGATEAGQTYVSNFSEIMAKAQPKSIEDAMAVVSSPTFIGDLTKGGGEAAFLGSFAGGIFATGRLGGLRREERLKALADAQTTGKDPEGYWALEQPTQLVAGRILPDKPHKQEAEVKEAWRAQATNLTDSEFEAVFTVARRAANVYRNTTGNDVGHYWGRLMTADVADAGIITLDQMIGEEGAKRLDASGRYPQVLGLRLQDAQDLEKAGRPMPEIRKITGWERGAEGKWQVEISDKAITLKLQPNELVPLKSGTVSRSDYKLLYEVISAPRLFEAYPELRNVPVVLNDNPPALSTSIAHYSPESDAIILTPRVMDLEATGGQTVKQVLLHEIQHWIQEKEGFATGGNSRTVFDMLPAATQRKVVQDRLADVENDVHLNETYKDLTERILERAETFAAYKAEPNYAKRMMLRNALLDDMGMRGAQGRGLRARAMELLEENTLDQIENLNASAMIESPRLAALKDKLGAVVYMDDMDWARDVFEADGYLQELYARLAGEVQARGTAARASLSQAEIDATPRVPDRPRKEQIVKTRDALHQKEDGEVLGSTTRYEDGRMLVKLFEGHNVSTMLHESAHVFRRMLYTMLEEAAPEHQVRLRRQLTMLENWAGVKNGEWTVDAEEKWATGAEQYLRSGRAPIPKLQRMFDQFKVWLRSIYDDLAAQKLATFSPEVEAFFNEYLLDTPVMTDTLASTAKLAQMKREDRNAWEAKVGLTQLPQRKAQLTEHLTALMKWAQLADMEREGLGQIDTLAVQGRTAIRKSEEAGILARAAVRRAGTLVAQLAAKLPEAKLEVDVPAILSSTTALKEFEGRVHVAVDGQGFSKKFLTQISNLVSFLEDEATTFQIGVQTQADQTLAVERIEGTLGSLVADQKRKKARVRLLVRELRKITGQNLADPKKERAEVVRWAEQYYASPKALLDYTQNVVIPKLEQTAKEILDAEAIYQSTISAIASRGHLPESYGVDGKAASSSLDEASLALIQDQIVNDIAARQAELQEVGGLVTLGDDAGIDVEGVLNDLTGQLKRAAGLAGETPGATTSLLDNEVALLQQGAKDLTQEQAERAMAGPVRAFMDGIGAIMVSIRDGSMTLLKMDISWNPMKALDPLTYDPKRPMNRLFGVRQRPVAMTDEQLTAARAVITKADGQRNLYNNVLAPAFRKAMVEAFPTLKDRQLITLLRDVGRRNLDALAAKYHEQWQQAVEAQLALGKNAPAEAKKAAAKKTAEALRRRERARLHTGISKGGLSPRMAFLLKQLEGAFDAWQNVAVRNGLWGPDAYIEDFMPRIYRGKDRERAAKFFRETLPLNGPNKHGFKRVFETVVEAYVVEGLEPATLDAAYLIEQYGRSISDTIEKQRLLRKLEQIAPDLFDWVDISRNPADKDFMDISKFVVAGRVPGGDKRVGQLRYAHKSIATILQGFASASAFDSNDALSAIKKTNQFLKRIQLAIDVYHLFQVTRVAAASGVWSRRDGAKAPFKVWREGLAMLDPNHPQHPLVKEFVQAGLQVSAGDWARRKMHEEFEKEFLGKMPTMSQLYHKSGEFIEGLVSRPMWEEYVPGLKVLVAASHLERLMANPRMKDMSREALVRAAVTVANDKFGGMSWSLRGRTKTTQDLFGIMMLAPDWLETRFRNVLGAVKPGAEGRLWREYWFGEGGVAVADKLRGNEVQAEPRYWATGYILQGMMLHAFVNLMLATLWMGDEDDEKKAAEKRGWNFFTSIIVPTKDKRGYPLQISYFATVDYFNAFLSDINTIAPLERYFRNRQSAILRGTLQILSGKDYTGEPVRPSLVSPESVGILLDTALPWMNNIFYGSVGDVAVSDRPAFAAARSISRLLGGHTTSTFPAEPMASMEFYLDRGRRWNYGLASKYEQLYMKVPGVKEIALQVMRQKAYWHNKRLLAFIEATTKDPALLPVLIKFRKELAGGFMAMPGEAPDAAIERYLNEFRWVQDM